MIKFLLFCSVLFVSAAIAQNNENSDDVKKESVDLKVDEIDLLKKRIQYLEDVQNESSEILKMQLADQHFDQNSRGYFEVKIGQSMFSPEEIEDENDEFYSSLDGETNWGKFRSATIFEFEIGKSFLDRNINGSTIKHEIGIGYQLFKAEQEAKYKPDSGQTIKIYETVDIHTLFARYAMLFSLRENGKTFFGPGVTLGYSPKSDISIDFRSEDEGVKVTGESTSFLFEIFGKFKMELSRYSFFVMNVGYRSQQADDLRLSAADIVSISTQTDLDASGLFGTLGLAIAF